MENYEIEGNIVDYFINHSNSEHKNYGQKQIEHFKPKN